MLRPPDKTLSDSSRPGWFALLCVLLSACVGSAPAVREESEAYEPISSWVEARADPSCVVPHCEEERCALWRCRALVEAVSAAPQVLPTRGPMPQAMRPPWVGAPSRWWGYTLAAPSYEEPVFEIPWHDWKNRQALTHQRKHPLVCMLPPEPLEKHHIFPQARDLAMWFDTKHINIHDFTITLPRSVHRKIHSGGEKGGQWNAAWRSFQISNPEANLEEIWRFAFELMWRFGLNGPFTPYYCQD